MCNIILFKNLLKYRKFIKINIKTNHLIIKNNLILVCNINAFTGKGLLLNQIFFNEIKKNDWFKFKILNSFKLLNKKQCCFLFSNLKELLNFIILIKSLSIFPRVIFPIKILNGNSSLELPLSIFKLISKNILTTTLLYIFFWKNIILFLYLIIFNLLIKKS